MSLQAIGSKNWLEKKKINFSKLDPDFMPGYQKEIECYKKAVIKNGVDDRGREVGDTSWPRDLQPGERSYYNWVKLATDDKMKWNPARAEDGAPIKGTGAKHIVNQITRVKTSKGEFLVTNGTLTGYDLHGNSVQCNCRHPEEWMETKFNFVRGVDTEGIPSVLFKGINGLEKQYLMPFNIENVRKLAKLRANDKIPFVLFDEVNGTGPHSIPNDRSIEYTIEFFMKDFNYLYNGDYVSQEEKNLNMRYAELLKSGKTAHEANEIIEKELERGILRPPQKDKKSGVA